MLEDLKTFAENWLQMTNDLVLIAIVVGYFVLADSKKESTNKDSRNDLDIIVLSSAKGIILFLLFRGLIESLLVSLNLLSTFSVPQSVHRDAGLFTGFLFLGILIGYLVMRQLLEKLDLNKEQFVDMSRLNNVLIVGAIVLGALCFTFLIVALFSYNSSFDALSNDLLTSTSLGIFYVILILMLTSKKTIEFTVRLFEWATLKLKWMFESAIDLLSQIYNRLLNTKTLSRYFNKKIPHKAIFMCIMVAVLLYLSVQFYVNVVAHFPEVRYGEGQIIRYDVMLFDYNMTPQKINGYLIRSVDRVDVRAARTLFIENKGNLDNFKICVPNERSEGTDAPQCTATLDDNLRGVGFTYLNYSEKYGGFVLRFDNLNESKLKGMKLSGYRKEIAGNDTFYMERIDTENDSVIGVFAINNLNEGVRSYRGEGWWVQTYLSYEGPCLLYDGSAELYNMTSNKPVKLNSGLKSDGIVFAAHTIDGAEIFSFQVMDKVLNLNRIYIPPHTNLTVSFKVLCS